MTLPMVAVIVLAHNNYSDTYECLESVRSLTYHPVRIYVVDNASTDGTATRLSSDFPQAIVIQTPRNLGVAGGFNAGVREALQHGADFVFVLNNDTSLSADMMEPLVSAADTDPRVGVLMPKIVYYDEPARIWSAGARYRRFPPAIVMRGLNHMDGGPFDVPALIDYAPTCGLLIHRRSFERVGLFDDGYFFYFDDWDFSLRVRQAGLTIRYVPAAHMRHKVSRTIQMSGRSPFFWRTWGTSGARFYRRFGRPSVISAAVHLGYLALREGLRVGPGPIRYFIQGIFAGWRQPLTLPPTIAAAEVHRG